MTNDEKLMQQALDALEAMQMYAREEEKGLRICDEAIEALRARLAQPEPEPVAWRNKDSKDRWVYRESKIAMNPEPLYTAPPQREWQGLTDEEVEATALRGVYKEALIAFAHAIEAKLREKNG